MIYDTTSISGCLKTYPEDFIVDEINLDGDIAQITSTDIPDIPDSFKMSTNDLVNDNLTVNKISVSEKQVSDIISQEIQDKIHEFCKKTIDIHNTDILEIPFLESKEDRTLLNSFILNQAPYLKITNNSEKHMISLCRNVHWNELYALLPSEEVDNLMRFFYVNTNSNNTEKRMYTISSVDDKESRTKIHLFLKQLFPFVYTSTDKQNNILITCKPKIQKSARMKHYEKSVVNSNYKIFYLSCILRKKNIETTEFLSSLSKQLSITNSSISIAGIKDKKAITTQYITFKNVLPKSLNSVLDHVEDVSISNYKYILKPLNIGDLKGNLFTLCIRSIKQIHKSILIHNIEYIKQNGFPNYYGIQRIGMSKYIYQSPDIGKYILEQNYEKVIDLLLEPDPEGDNYLYEGLSIYKTTHNINDALKIIPKSYHIIINLLKSIRRYGSTQYSMIYDDITNINKQMYIKSYQSQLINNTIKYRFENYGNQILLGDLVYEKQNVISSTTDDYPSKRIKLNTDSDRIITNNTNINITNDIHIVTENDILNNIYTIQDVLIPLLCYNMIFPENEMGNYYKKYIQENLSIPIETLKEYKNTLAMSGGYRNILIKPSQFDYIFVKNTIEPSLLIELHDSNKSFNNYKQEISILDSCSDEECSLLCQFQLSKGVYATELMSYLSNNGFK